MKQYLRYYFLEDYLFGEVHKNFHRKKSLTAEEFMAIVIWKRVASKTNIAKGIKSLGKSVREITGEVYQAKYRKTKLKILTSIPFIGIAIASAILTVLYPEEFTLIDYSTRNSLRAIGVKIAGDPENNVHDFLAYVDTCKKKAQELNLSLRDFDRSLWGKDFYEGEKGLKEVAESSEN